ncbi:MAG: ABC transporter ATP-binding protein [Sumerlaeia bacterium]
MSRKKKKRAKLGLFSVLAPRLAQRVARWRGRSQEPDPQAEQQRAIMLRVIGMLMRWKRWIIVSNTLIILSSLLSVFSLLALFPILKVAFNSPLLADGGAAASSQPAAVAEQTPLEPPQVVSIGWYDELKRDLDAKRDAAMVWVTEQSRENPQTVILAMCLIFAAAATIKSALDAGSNAAVARIQVQFQEDLTHRLFRHVLGQDAAFFHWNPPGRIMTRIYNDVAKMGMLVQLVYGARIRQPIHLFFLLVLLFFINGTLALLVLLTLPVIAFPAIFIARRIREVSRKETGADGDVMSVLEEQANGARLIKSHASEDFEANRFRQVASSMFDRREKRMVLKALGRPSMELITTLGTLAAVALGVQIVLSWKLITGEQFLLFLIVMTRVYKPVKTLSSIHVEMQRSLMSAEAVFKMLDEAPRVVESSEAKMFPPDWREIRFEKVWFRYGKKARYPVVLKNVSLTLRRGEFVAIAGANGSGKSTLASLLCRLYDPVGGEILVDGEPLKYYNLSSLRNAIGLVHQDALLFNMTIAENIAYGVPLEEVDMGRVRECAQRSGAARFIEPMKEGYETMVGTKGGKLSGGQRQLITLARLLYHAPPIIIYDEPTAHLDEQAGEQTLAVMQSLVPEHTILMITHDAAHAVAADRILRLRNGELTEEDSAGQPPSGEPASAGSALREAAAHG